MYDDRNRKNSLTITTNVSANYNWKCMKTSWLTAQVKGVTDNTKDISFSSNKWAKETCFFNIYNHLDWKKKEKGFISIRNNVKI